MNRKDLYSRLLEANFCIQHKKRTLAYYKKYEPKKVIACFTYMIRDGELREEEFYRYYRHLLVEARKVLNDRSN